MTETSHNEHDLDQWLATGLATLQDALDDILDLDAGLADAQLPGLQSVLTQALDEVLDLDTGLQDILPTMQAVPPTAPTPPTPPSDDTITGTVLGTFTDNFCSLPAHARLNARTWFPLQQLVIVRSIAHLVLRARDIDHALNHDLDLDHTRDRAHDLALAVARALDRARDRARALTHDLAKAHTFAYGLVHNLDRAHDRTLAHDLNRALDRALAHAHARASALAHASARASALASADRLRFVLGLIAVVDRLEQAITNMMGADLTQMDLRGISLEGLRWSTATRWPSDWVDQIRQNSVELQPGIYEVRYGGVDADLTIDTSV